MSHGIPCVLPNADGADGYDHSGYPIDAIELKSDDENDEAVGGVTEGELPSKKPKLNASASVTASVTASDPRKSFKLRAECCGDIGRLLLASGFRFTQLSMEVDKEYGEVDVSFESDYTLSALRAILRKIVDGHVMLETLDYASTYTGERKYGI
jgi:hypothetical protein